MILNLKNIGRIGSASIAVDGITVIAGENNTGKSTISRAFFAMFNSLYNVESRVSVERVDAVRRLIDFFFSDDIGNSPNSFKVLDVSKTIIDKKGELVTLPDVEFQQNIENILSQNFKLDFNNFDGLGFKSLLLRIKDVLKVSDDDWLKLIFEKRLNAEFNEQICNIFTETDGEIQLQINDSVITVDVRNDGEIEIHNSSVCSLNMDAIYLDDPLVVDDLRSFYKNHPNNLLNHQTYLRHNLFMHHTFENNFEEILTKKRLGSIYEVLSNISDGDLSINSNLVLEYRKKGLNKSLDARNLSTGLKSFAILKKLLIDGVIKPNDLIILDEPEVHLHPKWQLLFAELIVLIQKEFNIHVLLNTHSPYFLNAIEVYTANYGVKDRCKFYLSYEQNEVFCFDDVTDNVEAIYSKLARPFQDLENEAGRL